VEKDIRNLWKHTAKSIIKASSGRFGSIMAMGQSLRAAKLERWAAGESTWMFSTGKMHSFNIKIVSHEYVLAFVNWA
jgi:hypothetical protein